MYRTKSPLESLIADEETNFLAKALDNLEPQEKEALAAKWKLSFAPTVKELALSWNCKPQWVYQCADKALLRLRKSLCASGVSPC
jgi:DNA-directed RNA polymerase sigma subunit (sigma70/sigma32)